MGMIGAALVALLLLVDGVRRLPLALRPGRPQSATPSTRRRKRCTSSAEDGFHSIPFTNPMTTEIDPATFAVVTKIDTDTLCQPTFLGRGWSYSFFGLQLDRHLLAPRRDCPWNILGTDRDGRDVLSRLLVGSQLTMSIALLVVVVSVTLGTLVGIISGYLGGVADHWIQRGVEFFLASPKCPSISRWSPSCRAIWRRSSSSLVICADPVQPGLGAAGARGARQDAVDRQPRLCRGRRGGRRRPLAHRRPPHPAQRDEPRHRRDDAAHPVDHADRELPRASSASP